MINIQGNLAVVRVKDDSEFIFMYDETTKLINIATTGSYVSLHKPDPSEISRILSTIRKLKPGDSIDLTEVELNKVSSSNVDDSIKQPSNTSKLVSDFTVNNIDYIIAGMSTCSNGIVNVPVVKLNDLLGEYDCYLSNSTVYLIKFSLTQPDDKHLYELGLSTSTDIVVYNLPTNRNQYRELLKNN